MNAGMISKAKALLYILNKQYLPDAEEIKTVLLLYKMSVEREGWGALSLMNIYNYGCIQGIRAERQRRRQGHD